MKYTQIFSKTSKTVPKDEEATNAKLLIRAGYIDKTMAGVYSFLPLGNLVLKKIETIVRDEMDKIGSEILLPAISPKSIWEQTKRLEEIDVMLAVRGANELSRKRNSAEYILNSTHEDVLTPIAQKFLTSYKDFPQAVYQIQTKFRNEPRAKSGLLRGREFRMKDMYSFHTSENDMKNFYESVKKHYLNIFREVGLLNDTVISVASGGDFTKDYSHEFQVKCEAGEDTIYHDPKSDIYYNKEVLPKEHAGFESFKASEVGNIFPLKTKFSDLLKYRYTDEMGEKKPVYMASYGLGTSRLMGVLVEKFHDDKGIIWPVNVSPFMVHMVSLSGEKSSVSSRVEKIYKSLQERGIEVLLDDRDVSAGQKFNDSDLIGVPNRLVVSEKTLDKDSVEIRDRKSGEVRLVKLSKLDKEFTK